MATKPAVAVGLWQQFAEGILAKFDSAGNTYPHGHGANYFAEYPGNASGYYQGPHGLAMVLDSQGNTYQAGPVSYLYDSAASTAAYGYAAFTLIKADPNGYPIWRANHGAAVTALVVDASGNAYTVGDPVNAAGQVWQSGSRAGYYTTRKYSPAGELLWSADHGYSPTYVDTFARMAIALGADGYLYTGGGWNATTGNVTRYDPATGAVLAQLVPSASAGLQGMVVDASGHLFLIGISNTVLAKYDGSGALLASAPLRYSENGDGYYPRNLAMDADGTLVIRTDAPYYNYLTQFLFRYDSNCALVAEQTPLDSIVPWRGMALDPDGRIYLVAKSYGTPAYHPPQLAQFDADFDPVWANTTALTGKGDAHSVAATVVETPPLAIPLRLAVPEIIGDRVSHIPGLPLPLGIGIPRLLRDYVGPPMPAVYRLELTGDPDPLPLPISALQIRRNATGVFVEATIPAATGAILAGIEARSAGDLVVYRGVRFPDGAEQLDMMLQVALSSLRYDGGSNSASVTLQGQADAPTDGGDNGTRYLQQISYRNNASGRRRVRCAVDTYLRAGDVADLGAGETMLVGEIVCTIGVSSAAMEVVEA